MIIESEAWLLHKKLQGDTSLQLTLFTKEYGIVNCLYKGGLKKQAGIQSFMRLWVSIDSSNKGTYIRKLEMISPVLTLKSISLFSALYLNELLYLVLKGLEPFSALYIIYENTLIALNDINERLGIEVLLRRFELILLEECGYQLPLQFEVNSTNPIQAGVHYSLIEDRGFYKSEKGFLGNDLLAMANNDFSQLSTLKTAKIIMRKAINNLLEGKKLTSRQFFSSQ